MKNEGFTLVELAISLLIIGLLLVGVLGPLSTQIEQKERQGTQEQLNDVKEAVLGFAISEGRLPCPDCPSTSVGSCNITPSPPEEPIVVGDGLEDRIRGSVTQGYYCATDIMTAGSNYYGGSSNYYSIGKLPFATLGVAEFDAWREHFNYAVTSDFADGIGGANNEDASVRPDPCGTATIGVSFELCSGGNINVVDAASAGSPVVNDIPAIVFSTGKHGTSLISSDQSADEQENTNNDNVFVFKDFSQASGSEFDDLMIWISPNILKNRMVQAGRLP